MKTRIIIIDISTRNQRNGCELEENNMMYNGRRYLSI